MFDYFLDVAEGAIESISEGVTQVVDGFVDLEVQKYQETNKDPETLKAAEPVKATRTDGSTIVGTTNNQGDAIAASQETILGFDKQTVLIGGGVLTALILTVALIAGRR